jgi:hypothetical protein
VVSTQLVNALSRISRVTDETSAMTHDETTHLLAMESKLDDLLQ